MVYTGNMDTKTEERLKQLNTAFLAINEDINLSAFRTDQSCWIGNILDSMAAADMLKKLSIIHSPLSIIDVGTGGGFPLLPLAILFKEFSWTGVDSTKKKIDAIERIVQEMSIKNVQLICDRAETLGKHPKHREQYDVVTARAVAEINVLLEYASPFTKPGGKIILWKSMEIQEELQASRNAQKELQCGLIDQHVYALPGDFGKRQLLIFEKTGKLSATYPRAIGIAKKKPLR